MRIAIVGAEPAGAIAAVRLARCGAAVSIFDPSHPREKPCGGGLTARALDLVSDVIDLHALAPVIVRSAVIETPPPPRGERGSRDRSRAAEVALTDCGAAPGSSLIVVRRAAFDRALADAAVAAGARLYSEKAIDVRPHAGAMLVRTDRAAHVADFVLGADGANSVARKRLAAPFTRDQLSVAAGFFVHGVTMRAICIQVMREQPGYLWSFPRHDHLAVGICAPATSRATAPLLQAQSLSWINRRHLRDARSLKAYAWPIPSAGFKDARRMDASGPGWMLLGDAAGLVDPLTREGIYYALLSGTWAAEALTATPITRAPVEYAERLRLEVHPELSRAARLSTLFFSHRFQSLFVDALSESAPLRETFRDLVAGSQPYRGLRRRLLATREWSLAGRAIRVALTPAFAGTMRSVDSAQTP